ncbi:MAG: DUF86 domain-containing protein [Brevinematia bacterium]
MGKQFIVFKEKYSEIEWKEISRTRDKLIHHYFGVNINIVWDIIKNDIPILLIKLKKIISSEN